MVRIDPEANKKGVAAVGFKQGGNTIYGQLITNDSNGLFFKAELPNLNPTWELQALDTNKQMVYKTYPADISGRMTLNYEILGKDIPNNTGSTDEDEKKDDPTTTPSGATGSSGDSGSGGTKETLKIPDPKPANLGVTFESMFGGSCPDTTKPDENGYQCWIRKVWNWAITIAISLSVLVLTAAGYLYMTSAGNPDRIGLAKKLMIGVFSGIGLLVLSRVLLVNVIGLGAETWNVGS